MHSRRRFITEVGAATATALVAPAAIAGCGSGHDDAAKLRLEAAPHRFAPRPGADFPAVAFNGSIPGPTIRVAHGARVNITYANRSGRGGTIHWHGLVLPNDMDGVEGITQPLVSNGGDFAYEFVARSAGTRWYHDHVSAGQMNGLFGLFVVEDENDERADLDVPIVLHDVPIPTTVDAAMRGISSGPMIDPPGSAELAGMSRDDRMGDEVGYRAHCINGKCYPATTPIVARVGERVRFRILNANPTQTRYVRLAQSTLRVTHADGNPLPKPVDVDALRVGVGERYDAWFTPKTRGSWLLQTITADPQGFEQAVVVRTEDAKSMPAASSAQGLNGLTVLSYELLAGGAAASRSRQDPDVAMSFTIGGGRYGSSRWTLDGATWPHTPKIRVRRNDRVTLRFTNTTDMDHPLHLHGHTFALEAVDGLRLRRPLAKDTALIRSGGGKLELSFVANSPPGRWLLHCHNLIHMMDGMMTEVVYES